MFVINHHSLPHPMAPGALSSGRRGRHSRSTPVRPSRWTRHMRPLILGSVTFSPVTAEPVGPARKGPEWHAAASTTGCEPWDKPSPLLSQKRKEPVKMAPNSPPQAWTSHGGPRV